MGWVLLEAVHGNVQFYCVRPSTPPPTRYLDGVLPLACTLTHLCLSVPPDHSSFHLVLAPTPPTFAPSFGRVYLANWRGVFVACKVLLMGGAGAADPQRALTLSSPVLNKLEEEAGLLASLRHPNIVSAN